MTSTDDHLAPPASTLEQLQRRRGSGWLTARDSPAGRELLERCLAQDPRRDNQVETRRAYDAHLARALGVSAWTIEPEAVDDE